MKNRLYIFYKKTGQPICHYFNSDIKAIEFAEKSNEYENVFIPKTGWEDTWEPHYIWPTTKKVDPITLKELRNEFLK